MIRAVLFDLDGTLLYTLPDMAAALNAALASRGFPARTLSEVRGFVGNGVRKLVERACPPGTDEAAREAVYREYERRYAAHWRDSTAPYPGIPELLGALRRRGIAAATVTNKAHGDAAAMMEHFFGPLIAHTEGKKDGRPTKPGPESAFAALAALGVSPGEALYVGDSGVDAQTGENAGMDTVLVSWGYWDEERLQSCRARGIIHTPAELLDYL
ncbi:MAG: HAD-IA family hydrolase [Oscillospiraceae bacterium]|nr:HAD-IA family hydrolase [Oscillospiraceae bacterium]